MAKETLSASILLAQCPGSKNELILHRVLLEIEIVVKQLKQ